MTTNMVMSLIVCSFGASIFLFIRNNWVFGVQMKLINNPHESEYLSYHQMFIRFWVWDIEKLKRNK